MRVSIYLFGFLQVLFFFAQNTCREVIIRDSLNATSANISCNYPFTADGGIALHADYTDSYNTTQYTVESVSYAPVSSFQSGTLVDIASDDTFSGVITIPFQFSYFGQMYDKLVIGDNGIVSFDTTLAHGDSPFYGSELPNAALFSNTIFALYHDITNDDNVFGCSDNPATGVNECGEIRYDIIGSAPCRKFVVNYQTMNHFNDESSRSTFQLILHEGSNAIEVQIKNKPINNETSPTAEHRKYATIGIQSADGYQAYSPENRNHSIFAANNEAWKFVPSGDSVVKVDWYDADNNFLGSGDDIIFYGMGETEVRAEAIYQYSDGNSFTVNDTFPISMANSYPNVQDLLTIVCDEYQDGIETIDLMDYASNMINNNYDVTFYLSQVDAENDVNALESSQLELTANSTFFVRLSQNLDCFDVGKLDLDFRARPNVLQNQINICDINVDGTESIILNNYVNTILGVSSTADIAFFSTMQNAQTGQNAITNVTLTGNKVIYIAASFGNSCNTVAAINFNLVDGPNVPSSIAVNICNNVEKVNLASYLSTDITANYSNIKFYRTYENAVNEVSRINNFNNFSINNISSVYVRVTTGVDCYSIIELDFNYFAAVEAVLDQRLQCDSDENGEETFDLTLSIYDMIGNNSNGVSISYFISQDGAENDIADDKINTPTAYTVPVSNTEVWVRFENANGCVTVQKIKLFAVPVPEISVDEHEYCDADQDQQELVLLSTLDDQIIGGQVFVENVYYATMQNAIAQVNPISNVNAAPEATVYVRMAVVFEGEEFCSDIFPVQISLILFDVDTITETIEMCDINNDGQEEIVLSEYFYMSEFVQTSNVEYINAQGNVITSNELIIENGTQLIIRQINGVGCHPDVLIEFTLKEGVTAQNIQHFICDDAPYNDETVNLIDIVNADQPALLNNPYSFYKTKNAAINLNQNAAIANPESFLIDNNLKKAWLRLEAENGCYSLIVIAIKTTKSPEALTDEITVCDASNDGSEFINLADYSEGLFLNSTGEILFYNSEEDAYSGTNAIESKNVQNGTVIYAKTFNGTMTTCATVSSLQVNLVATPVVNPINTVICDNGNDEVESYDLSIHQAEISQGADFTFNYFSTLEDAENSNNRIVDFQNVTVTPSQNTFYVRVDDSNSCGGITTITVQMNEAPVVQNIEIGSCDDDFNLSETFNLLDYTSEITEETSADITFYTTYEAAIQKDANGLVSNPQSHTTYDMIEVLFSRVENPTTGCFSIAQVRIEIYKLPKVVDTRVTVCDYDFDGNYDVLLTELDAQIVEDFENYSFQYFENYNDAVANANEIDHNSIYEIADLSTPISVRVTNLNGCSSITMVNFSANETSPSPELNNVLLEECDDDTDGLAYFNLHQVTSYINNNSNYEIAYFTSLEDARMNQNEIEDPSAFLSTSSNQVIHVRYTVPGMCAVIDCFRIRVNALPVNPFDGDILKCPDELVILDAGAEAVEYLWSNGETSRYLETTLSGTYSVTLTNKLGCTETFDVTVSNYPTFTVDYTFTSQNTVVFDVIEMDTEEEYTYEFSLDQENWQSSNVFFNLEQGVYTLYTRNKETGCMVELPFLVFDWFNMITPNGDGINDTWTECGLEVFGDEMSSLTVFDRYGKTIHTEKSNSCFNWDAKYQGRALPTDTYWFIVQLPDGRKFNGYIAIKNYSNGGSLK